MWAELKREAAVETVKLRGRGRGACIGNVTTSIGAALTMLGLNIRDRAALRELRLALASDVFGRKIESYNDLTDTELSVLSRRVGQPGALLDIKNWYKHNQ